MTPTNVQIVSASLAHVVSPRLLVELRGGYNRFHEDFFPEDGSFDPGTIGLNTVTNPRDFGLPLIRVAGYAPIGANASVPRGRVDVNTQAFANVSYTAGTPHAEGRLRVPPHGRGRLLRCRLSRRAELRQPRRLPRRPSSAADGRRVGDSGRQTFQNNHSLYAQDGFAVARGLTLNAGLRWDYYGVLGEAQNRLSVLDPAQRTRPGRHDGARPRCIRATGTTSRRA